MQPSAAAGLRSSRLCEAGPGDGCCSGSHGRRRVVLRVPIGVSNQQWTRPVPTGCGGLRLRALATVGGLVIGRTVEEYRQLINGWPVVGVLDQASPNPDNPLDVPVTVWFAPDPNDTAPVQPIGGQDEFPLPGWTLARLGAVYTPAFRRRGFGSGDPRGAAPSPLPYPRRESVLAIDLIGRARTTPQKVSPVMSFRSMTWPYAVAAGQRT